MFTRVGLVALCFWSLSSIAAFPGRTGAFKGGGMWKTNNGASGTWTSEMNISKDNDGSFTVKEALTIVDPSGQQTETTEWTAKPTGNDFFEIMIAGNKAGDGFCFDDTCQIKVSKAGESFYGEVFHFADGKIFRQGYDFNSSYKVAWDGVMAQ